MRYFFWKKMFIKFINNTTKLKCIVIFSTVWFFTYLLFGARYSSHQKSSKETSNNFDSKNIRETKYTRNSLNYFKSFEIVQTDCDYGENGPRILCAIFTYKAVHKTTLIPVHETWAKR